MTMPMRALVLAADDTGQVQTARIQTGDGAIQDAVEVAQPFGFASLPPGDGAITHVLVLGGDPANLAALPLGCPAVRFGALAQGEAVIYGADGTRVAVRQGGTVQVWAATLVVVESGTVNVQASGAVTISAGGGVTIDANVQVNGSIVASGDITDQNGAHGSLGLLRTAYDTHDHPAPGGTTGLPDNIV